MEYQKQDKSNWFSIKPICCLAHNLQEKQKNEKKKKTKSHLTALNMLELERVQKRI